MKTLKFNVKLRTDVILNQKASVENSPNATLDFIPGSCFLGIVAKKLYKDEDSSMLHLFHTGEVRFGDAHPANGNVRGLRVPAAMMQPKLDKSETYISFLTDTNTDEMRRKQLKQCRTGFYDFSTTSAAKIEADTSMAVKSAHDKDNRTSKKERMYTYEALRKGLTMYFDVEVDDENLVEAVKTALEGTHRVGRSRSAQYGLVKITEERYDSIESSSKPILEDYVVIYADGRLIFLDENGHPTFRPTAEQLGVQGEIDWSKSQVRTFQYAPYNGKRQCFDTDRCGIEKGSVIVVKGNIVDSLPTYIGSYRNEGFGKVIYNPIFMQAETDGRAKFMLFKPEKKDKQEIDGEMIGETDSDLVKYLVNEQKKFNATLIVYELVNNFVDAHRDLFKGDKFASQWRTIRSLATIKSGNKTIYNRLFGDGKEDKKGYLMHGVAAEKWEQGGRRKALMTFFDEMKDFSGEDQRKAIVNLASEMAKICRKEDRNESK